MVNIDSGHALRYKALVVTREINGQDRALLWMERLKSTEKTDTRPVGGGVVRGRGK